MLKIGLIGADSFHALAFARLANLPVSQGGSGLNACINAIWGESEPRTSEVVKETNIPLVVKSTQELLCSSDAVMIVTRDGSAHLKQALPFIKKSLPVWIDKPFTYDMQDAQAIIDLSKKNKTLLSGGSFCKYCPDVLNIKNRLAKIGGTENIYGAHFNFPAQASDPYGGFHFYAPHTAEILSTIFGSEIRSIKADETNANVIAIFKYDTFSVSVNFAQVSDFSCIIYGKTEVLYNKIDITDIYRHGFKKVVTSFISGKSPESTQSLLYPIKIVNALIEAVNSNKEIYV